MLLVPLLLLASTLHAGPETFITEPVPNASPYAQTIGDIAADGDVALLVWLEEPNIAAARVDRDGKRLDPRPIALSSGPAQTVPAVARGANDWLVVWCERNAIVGRFVNDDGIADERFDIAPLAFSSRPLIAFDGTHFMVAWEGYGVIAGARLTADGRIVEVKDLDQAFHSGFDLVALPGGFALVTIHVAEFEYTVEALRLTTEGVPSSHSSLQQTASAYLSSVHALADGDTLVATWQSPAGVFVVREHQPVRFVGANLSPRDVIKTGGTVHLLLTRIPADEVLLISEDGSQTRSLETGALRETFEAAAAASFGGRALVATSERTELSALQPYERDIRTHVVDELQQDVVPAERLATEPSLQRNPAIARRTDDELLAVWTESGLDGPPMLLAVRTGNDGRPIDRTPIVVSPVALSTARAQVASDGSGYLVVWADTFGALSATPVRADGTPGPTTSLGVARGLQACVAWNGTEYLVGQFVYGEGTRFPRTVAQVTRVSRDGVPGAVTTVSGLDDHTSISCASAGDKTLVAWGGQSAGIGGTIVSAGGTPTGEIFISAVGNVGSAAANGERFAVAYEVPLGVEWALVTSEGTVTRFGERRFPGSRPRIAARREGWVLAREIGGNLDATALGRDGHRTDGLFAISDPPMHYEGVALAGGDVPIAIYMRELETPLLSRWRVFTRTITSSNPRRRAARH
ncbi:MAG: hypothetical protein QOJ98_659 [Acidobacteriota bacterium]|nr:hypothetical protein [Acidobacteriota bacterium]